MTYMQINVKMSVKVKGKGYMTWYTNVYKCVKVREHVAVYMAVYEVYGIRNGIGSVRYQKRNRKEKKF